MRILHDVTGGQTHYARQPDYVKALVRGLRKDLIIDRFPTAHALVRHLNTFDWPIR